MNVIIILVGSSITSVMVVTIEGKLQSYKHSLTTFGMWLQYVEGGRGSDKQKISKYFVRETSPNLLMPNSTGWGQQQAREHGNT